MILLEETKNRDFVKKKYTYVVSYMTKDKGTDHYEIFPSDEGNNPKADAETRYVELVNNENIYMASLCIEIATTECR